MRQVTGSNPSPSANRMSIQLTLSGHSFSRSELPRLSSRDERTVEIEIITDRVMLAPTEVVDEQKATELMQIAGFHLQEEDQVVVVREEKTNVVALIALPRVLLATIEDRYGRRAELTTPLLRSRLCAEPTAWFYMADDHIYIKVWSEGRLRVAEALPRKKAEDVLYYASVLDRQFDLNRFRVVVSGVKAVESEVRVTTKLLNKFYKKVVCE